MTLPLALAVVVLVLAVLGAVQLGVVVFALPAAVRAAQRRRAWKLRTTREGGETFTW